MFPVPTCLKVAMRQHNFTLPDRMDDVNELAAAFDAHTHLDFPAFDADRAEVMARARAAGVTRWVIAGADPADWSRIDQVCAATGAVPCHGIHPWWVRDLDDDTLIRCCSELASRETSGIGETGLDWLRDRTNEGRARQARCFRQHRDIAQRRRLPLVLHCVRAYPALLEILEETGPHRGMIHSWSGPPDCIPRAVELGLYISFSASATRSRTIAEAARRVPADRLLVETDCPDQPLRRGERGEPHHLVEIARHLATLRDCDPQQLLLQTAANAEHLFGGSA